MNGSATTTDPRGTHRRAWKKGGWLRVFCLALAANQAVLMLWNSLYVLPIVAGIGAAVLLWRQEARRSLIWLAGVAVAPALNLALALGLVFVWPRFDDYRHWTRFDSTVWKAQAPLVTRDTIWPPRVRMVDDLLARHRLKGMPRERVLSLLGPPTYGEPTDKEWGYELGPSHRALFDFTTGYLVLHLNRDGRVAGGHMHYADALSPSHSRNYPVDL